MADESCAAFDSVEKIDANSLNRFVVGADPVPRKMAPREVKALGDPFASTFFAKGKIPRSAQQVIDGIKASASAKSPLRRQKSFIVGEGSQLEQTAKTATVNRTLRFIVTLGGGPNGPDLFLSR